MNKNSITSNVNDKIAQNDNIVSISDQTKLYKCHEVCCIYRLMVLCL